MSDPKIYVYDSRGKCLGTAGEPQPVEYRSNVLGPFITNAKPKELSVDEMWARIIETKNVLDRTAKPTPRRHTGPLKDLLLGIVIGAAIMVALFLLGWAEAAL